MSTETATHVYVRSLRCPCSYGREQQLTPCPEVEQDHSRPVSAEQRVLGANCPIRGDKREAYNAVEIEPSVIKDHKMPRTYSWYSHITRAAASGDLPQGLRRAVPVMSTIILRQSRSRLLLQRKQYAWGILHLNTSHRDNKGVALLKEVQLSIPHHDCELSRDYSPSIKGYDVTHRYADHGAPRRP